MSDPGSVLYALITRCVLLLLVMAIGVETTRCFSCASTAYLSLWNQLMHHYFPPKNFTERCWQPDADVGTVPCASACFTLVEQVYEHSAYDSFGYRPCQYRLP
uniref:Secreted protein n=1 Tax=Ascaris lumbricoides TaxID=6252 RepID=A0A0M3IAJ0_ASCLU